MEDVFQVLWAQVVLTVPRLGAALAVFIGFWLAARIVRRLIGRFGERADPERRDALHLLGQAISATLLVVGAISALGTAGINVTAMVAGLGLTGFALGFALKDALSNLLAGVLILIYRPFKRGDRIAVAGFEGTVIGIDLRYTRLQGKDRQVLIPNSVLFTNSISLQQLEPEPKGTGEIATAPADRRP
jgi:small conductance mechanosensitive channel